MLRIIAPLTLFALAAGPALAETPMAQPNADVERIAKARGAIKGLAEGLKAKLVTAMKDGGPVAALDVCNIEAPKITAARSAESGMSVARTALKVRNQNNAADDFERRVMEQFIEKIKSGADAMKLEHAETVEMDGKKVFRYMKPIMTAGSPCLACHGSELKPPVAEKIKALYPKDEATGFSAGDMRGAFTVKQAIE
ncbi:MAG: DUF3365 domain-containing protein [Hyphomicrobiaceae bacterium]|nr:DUF3365 domain-containing protein [Hyphomicrobiaceae bacterium]